MGAMLSSELGGCVCCNLSTGVSPVNTVPLNRFRISVVESIVVRSPFAFEHNLHFVDVHRTILAYATPMLRIRGKVWFDLHFLSTPDDVRRMFTGVDDFKRGTIFRERFSLLPLEV
jgi:hypothetical protein